MHPVAARLHGALIRRPWVAPVVLAVLAGAVLLPRLGTPDRIMFDETYYVTDARGYLDTGVEPGFAVHPTLGKWLIAAGIALVGDTPTGWRIAGAVAGIAVVVLTHLLARRLLRGSPHGWWLALAAPVLLLADGLFITQSRIAMLDAFLVLFALAGLWVLVVDHDRRCDRGTPRWRPSLRVVAGVLFGLAIGAKWSGLLALGGAGLLTIGWELGAAARGAGPGAHAPPGPAEAARDPDGSPAATWWSVPRRAVAVLGSLVLVPAAVYALSWLPWLASYEHTFTAGCEDPAASSCSFSAGERVEGLVRHHDQMLGFHLGLEATHTYRSDPLGWPVLRRPVVYYWSECNQDPAAAEQSTVDPETGEVGPVCEVPAGRAGEVIALGNPALWWGFLLLAPLLVAGVATRDGRSAVPLVGWAATWLPWLLVSRTAFLFYLAPAVPLLAIGVVLALERIGRSRPVWRTYLGAVLGAAVGIAVTGPLGLLDVITSVRPIALTATATGVVGAALGGVADRVAPARATAPHTSSRWPARDHTAWWVAVTVAVVVGLGVWFSPVWLALPLDGELIRSRWWFPGWI